MIRRWAEGRVTFRKDPKAWIVRKYEDFKWKVLHACSVTKKLFQLKNDEELTEQLDKYNTIILKELNALMTPEGKEKAFEPGKAFVTFEWAEDAEDM